MLRGSVDYLPNTALIWLAGRTDINEIENELCTRIARDTVYCIWWWDRDSLSDWQWRMLARKTTMPGSALDYMKNAALIFAQTRPMGPVVVAHDEMLALEMDESGTRLGELNGRVQFPDGGFNPGYEKYLKVDWLELSAVDGASVRVYLLKGSQQFAVYGLRKSGDVWVYAGAVNISSKYADPQICVVDGDDFICAIEGIRTGGTGVVYEYAAWCRVDVEGLHFVHDWSSEGHTYWGGGPYNHKYTNQVSSIRADDRGRYVDHQLAQNFDNTDVGWNKLTGSEEDRKLVTDLTDLFTRTGAARYRWNDGEKKFVYSAAESEWTDAQVHGSFYDDELFIEQNFDTLVKLATGDDPARSAWVRLMLTRLIEGAAKERLMEAIDDR